MFPFTVMFVGKAVPNALILISVVSSLTGLILIVFVCSFVPAAQSLTNPSQVDITPLGR